MGMQSVIVHGDNENDDGGAFDDNRQRILDEHNDKKQIEKQRKQIETLKNEISELQNENKSKDLLINDAKRKEDEITQKMNEFKTKYEEMESKLRYVNDEKDGREN